MTTAAPLAGAGRLRRSPRRGRPGRGLLLYLLPAGIVLALLAVYPLVQLVRMSVSAVTASNLQMPWQFNGLDNYVRDAQQGNLIPALLNTLVFVVIVTALGLVGGLAAAIVLRGTGRVTAALLGLMVFIWALPPVVNGSVWKFLLGDAGLFNTLLRGIGVIHGSVPFLYDQQFALYSVALVNSWAIIPFNALVYRAAILGVPEEIFEAARLDGATAWQEIRHIMVPSARSTSLVLLVLTIVYAFRSFDFIYVMTYGGPGTSTNTLPFLSYLQAFVQFDYGMGSATALITAAIVVVLAVIYAQSIRREEAYS